MLSRSSEFLDHSPPSLTLESRDFLLLICREFEWRNGVGRLALVFNGA